jgi:hypothetical protein
MEFAIPLVCIKRAPAPAPAAALSSQGGPTNPLPTASDESEFSTSDDDTACGVCGTTSHAPVMLLCDMCDQGFHLYCLSPPLPHVPSGKWYCPKCTVAHAPSPAADESAQATGSPAASGPTCAPFGHRSLSPPSGVICKPNHSPNPPLPRWSTPPLPQPGCGSPPLSFLC